MTILHTIWNTWEQASKLFEKAVENAPTSLSQEEFLQYQIRMSNFVKEAASLSMDFSNKILSQITGGEKEKDEVR